MFKPANDMKEMIAGKDYTPRGFDPVSTYQFERERRLVRIRSITTSANRG
jgi:hypothetical protein